jgi:hypothetical protein
MDTPLPLLIGKEMLLMQTFLELVREDLLRLC